MSSSSIRYRFIKTPDNVLIIADFRWWVDNQDDLEKWMHDNLTYWKHEGMVLSFEDSKELLAFLLRWDG